MLRDTGCVPLHSNTEVHQCYRKKLKQKKIENVLLLCCLVTPGLQGCGWTAPFASCHGPALTRTREAGRVSARRMAPSQLVKMSLRGWLKEPRRGRLDRECQRCGRPSSLPLNWWFSVAWRAASAAFTQGSSSGAGGWWTHLVKGLRAGRCQRLLIAPPANVSPPRCPQNLCNLAPNIGIQQKPPQLSFTLHWNCFASKML